MPGIVALRDALSSQVVKRLAAANYPALVDGKILLGRQEQFANSAPPRIIMTPTSSPFGPVDVYSSQPGMVSAEGRRQFQQRSVATEYVRFEVRCWGTSNLADPTQVRDDDFDMTQVLYQAFIQAMCAPAIEDGKSAAVLGPITAGGVELETGQWTDGTFGSSQAIAYGREFVFGFRVPTPILDRLFTYAPAGVVAHPTTNLTDPTGVSSVGCGG